MSRNFISEQELVDHLLQDDTEAFEELYRRYCFSLYTYCQSKLQSSDDAKKIVRDIFIALWEQRHSLPINFSISVHLYTEVRKSVVKVINEKLLNQDETIMIEQQIIPGFAVTHLKQASQPVKPNQISEPQYHSSIVRKGNYENPWWNKYFVPVNLKGLRHAVQNLVNFW